MPSITTLSLVLVSLAFLCPDATAQSSEATVFLPLPFGGGGDNGSGSSKTAAPTPEGTGAILGVDGSGHTTYEVSDSDGPATIVAGASYVSFDFKFDQKQGQGFTQPVVCTPAAGSDGKKAACVDGGPSASGSGLTTIPATQVVIEITSTAPGATASAGGSGSQSQPSIAYHGKSIALPTIFLGIILSSMGWMLL